MQIPGTEGSEKGGRFVPRLIQGISRVYPEISASQYSGEALSPPLPRPQSVNAPAGALARQST